MIPPAQRRALLLALALALVGLGPELAWAVTSTRQADRVTIKILAINDLHGGIEATRRLGNRPVGGAAVLAAHLRARQAIDPERTILVHAGDMIGASPPISALLHDEPTILILNALGFTAGAVGNHELDKGKDELLRLQHGGCHSRGCALGEFPGASFRYLAANVVDEARDQTLVPGSMVVEIDGVQVGLIGLILHEAPTVITRAGTAGLRFEDEVAAGNRAVAELRAQGVRAIVALIHQGGRRVASGSPSDRIDGPIVPIVEALDDEVDLVVSGHTHQGYRSVVGGKLVTQAFAHATGLADVDLMIDRTTGDVVDRRAEIVTAYADVVTPDPAIEELVAGYARMVAPIVERVVATAATRIAPTQNAAGESALGNLLADAYLTAGDGTRIAFMNPGGIRADLPAGPLTYGQLFTAQPFGNSLVSMDLTGREVLQLLEQQWLLEDRPRILQVSRGFRYTWDARQPPGQRVVEVSLDGVPLAPDAVYRVATNNFLADGGDGFSILRQGANRVGGPVDLDALVRYLESQPQPIHATIEGRITRLAD